MKEISAGLAAHLASGSTTLALCFKVTRRDDAVFGFTSHDLSLAFDGVTYEPESGFASSELQASLGLAVDTAEVDGALSSDRIAEEDIARGLWDNAAIERWLVNWADVAQRHLLRKGSIGEISRGELAFQAEERGLAHNLIQETGRTNGRQCDAVLGDAHCRFDLGDPDFNGAGTVVSVADDIAVTASGLDAFAAGWFAQGVLTWTAGANIGATIEVRGHAVAGTDAILTLWQKTALAVAAGDTFAIVAGCDKTFATCKAKFDNAANFRGFPHMPGNDFALSVAKKSGPNDGGSFFN